MRTGLIHHQQHHKQKAGRCSGFTLTEVVVAASLLLLAMVPILRGMAIAHSTTATIERKTKSLALAQTKLDEIKARSINNFATFFAQTNIMIEGAYLCTVTESSAGAKLKNLTVSVGYDVNSNNAIDSDEISVDLATRLAERQ